VNIIELYTFLSILNIVVIFGRSGHVLNNKVGGAEVNKPLGGIFVLEETLEHTDQLLLAVLFIDQSLLVLDSLEALIESLFAILVDHVFCEFVVVTRSNIDHFFLFVSSALVGSKAVSLGAHGTLFSVSIRRVGRWSARLLSFILLLGRSLPIIVSRFSQVLNVLFILVLKELGIFI